MNIQTLNLLLIITFYILYKYELCTLRDTVNFYCDIFGTGDTICSMKEVIGIKAHSTI